jgi:hypothetical protein
VGAGRKPRSLTPPESRQNPKQHDQAFLWIFRGEIFAVTASGLRLNDIDTNGRRVPGRVDPVRRAEDTERLISLLICVVDIVKVERKSSAEITTAPGRRHVRYLTDSAGAVNIALKCWNG